MNELSVSRTDPPPIKIGVLGLIPESIKLSYETDLSEYFSYSGTNNSNKDLGFWDQPLSP